MGPYPPAETQVSTTTNNANEGALGTLRIMLRCAPCMSLSQFNARLQYKKNQTGAYIKTFLGCHQHKYLHGKAQELDSNGAKRKQRKAQVEYHQKLMKKNCEIDQQRKEWKDAATAKLHAVVPCLHREFDPHVPQNKDMPKQKEDKLKVLREAIVCYTSGEVTRQETTQEVPLETGKSEDEEP
ncbi:hypothetical protein F4604DRAFT_1926310 [Suillus subluteus]|nr:hypothetical protein F4604DRAFT_1926310 [Suillus subluteus]